MQQTETARTPEFSSHASVTTRDDKAMALQYRCPSCRAGELSKAATEPGLKCTQCAEYFPVFECGHDRIPWLFADPLNSRLHWKARYNGFLHSNSLDLERLRQARRQLEKGAAGYRRVNHVLHAREQYRNQVVKILAPLELEDIGWPADATGLLQSRLPRNQGLSSYTTNIYRDWAWDNGENDALLDAVASVLCADPRTHIGSVLTLGGGACRLSYDLHRRYAPALSVVLDMNPLLLQIGSRCIQGESVPLFEFPVAPLDAAASAVLQQCVAPEPLTGGDMRYVLGDALNLPFAPGSFNTVFTPWLVDIVSQDLKLLLPQINQCLDDGGMWLNTGSLAFFHHDESWCYSEKEVLELIEECGFEILSWERKDVSYLQSPHSAHGRTESILSFLARKTESVEAPAPVTYLPDWLLETSRSVPSSTEAAIQSSNYLLKSQVLAAVDGKKTISQIGKTLARQYGLGVPETIHAVRQILIDAWEEHSGMRTDREF